MTKAEFSDQFKRLRIAGYRLPVFDDVKIGDVITEWFDTFGQCSAREFSDAIDRLKQTKTDTFWPSTGQLWAHILEGRKATRIRRQASDHTGDWAMSDEDAQEFLKVLRASKDKILGRMTMPAATAQEVPDHVLLEQEDQETA